MIVSRELLLEKEDMFVNKVGIINIFFCGVLEIQYTVSIQHILRLSDSSATCL